MLLRPERQVAIDVVTNTATNAGLMTSSSILIIIIIVPTQIIIFAHQSAKMWLKLQLQRGRHDISHWSSRLEDHVQVNI